jgi:multidrug efflux pump
VLAIFLVPLFFVLVRKMFKDRPAPAPQIQGEAVQNA